MDLDRECEERPVLGEDYESCSEDVARSPSVESPETKKTVE